MAQGPNLACCLFQYCPATRNSFLHFWMFENFFFTEQYFVTHEIYMELKFQCTNKVQQEPSYTHAFMYCLWLLSWLREGGRMEGREEVQGLRPGQGLSKVSNCRCESKAPRWCLFHEQPNPGPSKQECSPTSLDLLSFLWMAEVRVTCNRHIHQREPCEMADVRPCFLYYINFLELP